MLRQLTIHHVEFPGIRLPVLSACMKTGLLRTGHLFVPSMCGKTGFQYLRGLRNDIMHDWVDRAALGHCRPERHPDSWNTKVVDNGWADLAYRAVTVRLMTRLLCGYWCCASGTSYASGAVRRQPYFH